MLDGSTGKVVASAKICDGTDATFFDASASMSMSSCSDGHISIIKIGPGDTMTVVQTLETKRGARTMALDPRDPQDLHGRAGVPARAGRRRKGAGRSRFAARARVCAGEVAGAPLPVSPRRFVLAVRRGARTVAAPLTLDAAITRAASPRIGASRRRGWRCPGPPPASASPASASIPSCRTNTQRKHRTRRSPPRFRSSLAASASAASILPTRRWPRRKPRSRRSASTFAIACAAPISRLVSSNRRVALADDIVGLATRAKDAAQARFNAGDVPRLELVQAELALVESENEASAARGEVRAAAGELNVLARAADRRSRSSWPTVSSGGALPSLESAMAVATGANADLLVLDRQIAEQTARRDLAIALKRSDLTAGAAYTFDAQPEFSHGYRASVALTVPLFTRHNAAVQVEDAELARLKSAREATATELRRHGRRRPRTRDRGARSARAKHGREPAARRGHRAHGAGQLQLGAKRSRHACSRRCNSRGMCGGAISTPARSISARSPISNAPLVRRCHDDALPKSSILLRGLDRPGRLQSRAGRGSRHGIGRRGRGQGSRPSARSKGTSTSPAS